MCLCYSVKLTRFQILAIFAHRNDEEARQIVDTENALAVLSVRHPSVRKIVAEQKGEKSEKDGSDGEEEGVCKTSRDAFLSIFSI